MNWFALRLSLGGVVLVVLGIILFTTERPPMGSVQHGFRGTAMDYVYNPRFMDKAIAENKIPASLPYLGNVGPKSSAVYKNVQVLGDVSVGEFTRLMASMTTWVEPAAGCAGCHNVANMASDEIYAKRVARRMLQMVRHINVDWTNHVQQTGVTCYTCHRGNPVPMNIWFENPGPKQAGGFAEVPLGKNHPSVAAGDSSLPLDPYTPFLEQSNEIRVNSTTALPTGDRQSIKQTEWTYSLMMSFSTALGVNCTYCHNTRAMSNWAQSTPQRVTAWYGIRMVRDLNNDYLDPLRDTLPPTRRGVALGDSPKVNCATCHNGVYKPLFGVSMAKDFPELRTETTP